MQVHFYLLALPLCNVPKIKTFVLGSVIICRRNALFPVNILAITITLSLNFN